MDKEIAPLTSSHPRSSGVYRRSSAKTRNIVLLGLLLVNVSFLFFRFRMVDVWKAKGIVNIDKEKLNGYMKHRQMSGLEKMFALSHEQVASEIMPSCRETDQGGKSTEASDVTNKTRSFETEAGHQERISLNDGSYSGKGKMCFERKQLDLNDFSMKGSGGLENGDRVLLGNVYYNAESVFEFGLGESSHIAAYTNIPRFAGVDSSAEWVSKARDSVPDRYRFYFADVGSTRDWGYPVTASLRKNVLDYQIAPLWCERYPFDVYLVDGRWRIGCVLASFLHAMARGGNMDSTRVLMHDYERNSSPRFQYKIVEEVADVVERSNKLAVLKLKANKTEEQVFQVWMENFEKIDR